VITQLSQLNPDKLGVIARTSAMRYKGSNKSARRIGQELGVAYLLEGSVRRAGRRVHITAQLIQVSDQTHLWARKYERGIGDILAIQSDVATAIASEIQIKLAPQARARLERTSTVEPLAYEAFLRGRYLWNQRTRKPANQETSEPGKRCTTACSSSRNRFSTILDTRLPMPEWRTRTFLCWTTPTCHREQRMNRRGNGQKKPSVSTEHSRNRIPRWGMFAIMNSSG
jgi:hypothetical protein